MLFGMPQEVQDALAAGVPFPSRLGTPADYAKLVKHIFENDMLNVKSFAWMARSAWRRADLRVRSGSKGRLGRPFSWATRLA